MDILINSSLKITEKWPLFEQNSSLKIIWDAVNLLITIYWIFNLTISVPLSVVLLGYEFEFYLILLLLLHIVCELNTSFYKNGVLMTERSEVLKY